MTLVLFLRIAEEVQATVPFTQCHVVPCYERLPVQWLWMSGKRSALQVVPGISLVSKSRQYLFTTLDLIPQTLVFWLEIGGCSLNLHGTLMYTL